MTIDRDVNHGVYRTFDVDHEVYRTNLVRGACSLVSLKTEQENLDVDLEAAASEIESLAVGFEEAIAENPDQFIKLVFPPVDPKRVVEDEEDKEGEMEEEKEEAPREKTWKDWLIDCLPVCPPPVCGVLKEQLITFTVMVIIGLVFFLIFWFVE